MISRAKSFYRKNKFTSEHSAFQPPGTIAYVGLERDEHVEIQTIYYTEKEYQTSTHIIIPKPPVQGNYWINIDGIHDIKKLAEVGQLFDLHQLVLEDIANTTQRPKIEIYDGYLFQSIKMISYDTAQHEIHQEQVSIILQAQTVITFQEKTGDVFGNIRQRITNSHGRIRQTSTDYLFYVLLDSIIDHYFLAIEKIGDYLDDLEDEVFHHPTKESLNKVQKNKRVLLQLRKAIYPLRESINKLLKEERGHLDESTKAYLHDAYDHCLQVIDTIESYREINTGLKDMYMSSVSLKMNQIMQVLTIISSVFIPLSFIAGVYGMNFEHIPELHWEHGYAYFWMLCGGLFIGLLGVFMYKKWL